jgi:hypothetical protein
MTPPYVVREYESRRAVGVRVNKYHAEGLAQARTVHIKIIHTVEEVSQEEADRIERELAAARIIAADDMAPQGKQMPLTEVRRHTSRLKNHKSYSKKPQK